MVRVVFLETILSILLSRNGTAVRLTYDHKATDEAEGQRIKDLGSWVIQGKVGGTLAVSRAFGDIELKEWVPADPYQTATLLNPDDSLLIVACDGLWDVCSDQTAVDLATKEETAQRAAEKLLKYAIENGTTDNLSVLVVKL
jgi:protein phosphatase PTC1